MNKERTLALLTAKNKPDKNDDHDTTVLDDGTKVYVERQKLWWWLVL